MSISLQDVHFRFRPGDLGTSGATVYSESDLALEYITPALELPVPRSLSQVIDQRIGTPARSHYLVIADTLTLTFDAHELQLVRLDAYTNWNLWRHVSAGSIVVKDRGALYIDSLFADKDRLNLDVLPRYEVAQEYRFVRIVLCEQANVDLYQIGTNLFAGVRGDLLTELLLTDIRFCRPGDTDVIGLEVPRT